MEEEKFSGDVACPHCGTVYEVNKCEYGRHVTCQICSNEFIIGQDDSASAPADGEGTSEVPKASATPPVPPTTAATTPSTPASRSAPRKNWKLPQAGDRGRLTSGGYANGQSGSGNTAVSTHRLVGTIIIVLFTAVCTILTIILKSELKMEAARQAQEAQAADQVIDNPDFVRFAECYRILAEKKRIEDARREEAQRENDRQRQWRYLLYQHLKKNGK